MLYTTLNKIREADPCKPRWKLLLQELKKTEADDKRLSLVRIAQINGWHDAIWVISNTLDREDISTYNTYLFVYNHARLVLEIEKEKLSLGTMTRVGKNEYDITMTRDGKNEYDIFKQFIERIGKSVKEDNFDIDLDQYFKRYKPLFESTWNFHNTRYILYHFFGEYNMSDLFWTIFRNDFCNNKEIIADVKAFLSETAPYRKNPRRRRHG